MKWVIISFWSILAFLHIIGCILNEIRKNKIKHWTVIDLETGRMKDLAQEEFEEYSKKSKSKFFSKKWEGKGVYINYIQDECGSIQKVK